MNMLLLNHKIIVRRWGWIIGRALALLILAWFCAIRPGEAAPPNSTIGPYRLLFRGVYHGEGIGTVTPDHVNLHGELEDDAGNRINFVANDLALNGSHFTDQFTAAGRTIKVSGRVDASGGPLQKARLVCNFTVVGVGHGRVAGDHK
jgi:hypothetical protein